MGSPNAGRGSGRKSGRRVDLPRRVAYRVMRKVTDEDGYANLALPPALRAAELSGRDAAFVTELVNGCCRGLGTYDQIIAAAADRNPDTLDPRLRDVLRLGVHQALAMRIPDHAAVAASVELARAQVGERVTGLVNAVLRRVLTHSLAQWAQRLSAATDDVGALALRTLHPRWIVEAYAQVLPPEEVEAALRANNVAPQTWLAIRPGLSTVSEIVAAGAVADPITPVGARWSGDPAAAPGVPAGRVGVQDPGSQLVALALDQHHAPAGHWLDLCAGPGGKAALLAGLAQQRGEELLAVERQPHRALLVAQACRAYAAPPTVIIADGTRPAWRPRSFARALVDAPCSGIGALRRRPEARWRRSRNDLVSLAPLQRALLESAIDAVVPGGLVAYVTCSPHQAETTAVVDAVIQRRGDVEPVRVELFQAPGATDATGRVQLWPHRDGTDAMFLAMLRRR